MDSSSSEVLAIIPARGQSKGLPGKNIIDLGGMPLVAWSIRAALACPNISRVVLSTDSEEIAEVGIRYGAEVPFLRPRRLASDTADVGNAITYTCGRLAKDGYSPDVQVTLFPTHPFRPAGLLKKLVALNVAGHASVTTYRRIRHTKVSAFYKEQNSRLRPLHDMRGALDLPYREYLRPYGLYLGYNANATKGSYAYLLDSPELFVDIDTMYDLVFAREILSDGLFSVEEVEL